MLNWDYFAKTKGCMNNEYVRVHLNKSQKPSSAQLSVRFPGDLYKKVTQNERIRVAYDEDRRRMYFDQGETKGYKLCGHPNKEIKITVKADHKTWEIYSGNYLLQRDDILNLYYINLNERKSD